MKFDMRNARFAAVAFFRSFSTSFILNIGLMFFLSGEAPGMASAASQMTLSAGGRHACAAANGSVVCWRGNAFSQLGFGGVKHLPVPMEGPGVKWAEISANS